MNRPVTLILEVSYIHRTSLFFAYIGLPVEEDQHYLLMCQDYNFHVNTNISNEPAVNNIFWFTVSRDSGSEMTIKLNK